MTHLSDAELVEAAATGLESTLREVSALDVPEPSPLFWDHFSARVRDAVAAEEPAASRWAWAPLRAPWIPFAGFCAIVIAVASTAWFVRPSNESTVPTAVASTASTGTTAATTSASQGLAENDDPVWAVLSAAAADLSDQETPSATLSVRPAAVDSAVQQLTPQERQELGRLLRSEMNRSSD